MSTHKEGYYWVKYNESDPWAVAQWNGDAFEITGDEQQWDESLFAVIGSYIPSPDEKKLPFDVHYNFSESSTLIKSYSAARKVADDQIGPNFDGVIKLTREQYDNIRKAMPYIMPDPFNNFNTWCGYPVEIIDTSTPVKHK